LCVLDIDQNMYLIHWLNFSHNFVYKITCSINYLYSFSFPQDLVRLVNTDRPYWLIGMTEMTRTFGLELLESVLTDFQPVFYKVII